jgi:hypothetical protein
VEDEYGTLYFYHGNTRIRVAGHFNDRGKPIGTLLEDVIRYSAAQQTEKNKNVSQIGLNTHNQGHEINSVALSTMKIRTKATTGSIPDRFVFFSIRISTSKF